MGDAAAEAMVDSLGDRWSYYIPASRYGQYTQQMNNAYVGIGITISVREEADGFTVDAVEQGGPAAEAGLLPGDILIGAEGQSVVGMDINGVSEIIRGDEGTGVTVTVRRGEEELTFTMERRQIKVIVATGRLLEGNVGLVTIENFDERCAEETIAVIESLLEQGATSLLFDVRYNPGGYKRELVKVLDYLLPEGPLFRSRDYDGAEIVDSSDAKCLDVPMAVLVNGSSYSAAEFFAAAIREYEAGFVVGTQTCGKGYFQNTMELPDGSAVGLSVGKYTTPNGVCLADVGGLTPDVVVEVDDETAAKIYAGTLEPENDPQIQAALEKLKQ
jgi:carboxyl-terminal processing protease